MTPELKWLDDPRVFRVNKLPAHSDHVVYSNREHYEQGQFDKELSLDGEWQFHFGANPNAGTPEFYAPATDRSDFTTIQVPGHIQLQGFGQIQYINTLYPWDGQVYRRPPFMDGDTTGQPGIFSEAADNPVGEYVKTFILPEKMQGHRLHITFDGVEQAMYLWLNGQFVGYSEDSFSRAEFDLTPYLVPGENLLAVAVYKLSTAAFLEDQDMFRFSGIFRSVRLRALPEIDVTDVKIVPTVNNDKGRVAVTLKLSSTDTLAGEVAVQVLDPTGTVIASQVATAQASLVLADFEVTQPQLWAQGAPNQYQLVVSVTNANGEEVAFVANDFGFRTIAIGPDNQLQLNGKRLYLNGVNRHEWSARHGRAITLAEMEEDLKILQDNHINAVRTSHYPNQVAWYGMMDRAGIYVMAETNLETHGTWQKMGAVEPSYNVPGSHDAWRDVVLDRAQSNYEQFKNHVSIIFWSLGNESFAGENLVLMNDYFKTVDPTRLTHYEGVFQARKYADRISDVESRMYATPSEIAAYLTDDRSKPYLNCEFMHSMGNSVGGLDDYMALYDEFPAYGGGFIWDFTDQALWQTDKVTGQEVLTYGGDFNDRHSDYEFSGNGIVFANRVPKPALQEVKYFYGKYNK